MIESPHQKKALIVLALTIVVSMGVFVWMIILNVGTLVIEAETPLIVTIGGKQYHCSQQPCEYKLQTKEYDIKIEKQGYFTWDAKTKMIRGESVVVTPNLRLIPYVNDQVEDITVDMSSQENITTKLPTDEKILAQDTTNTTRHAYIESANDNQKVFVWDTKNDPQLITRFQYLVEPIMAMGNNVILVSDNQKLYRVDIAEKRKELIAVDIPVRGIKWSQDGLYAAIETEAEDLPLLAMYDVVDKKIMKLPIQTSVAKAVWLANNNVLFVSFQELNNQMDATFAQIGVNADRLAGKENATLQNRLMEFDPVTKTFKELAILPADFNVVQIQLSQDQKQLNTLTAEGTLRHIVLEK